MQEVAVRLRFRTACLGNAPRRTTRGDRIFSMQRDDQGRVLFLPSWWRELLEYAAKVRSRYLGLVSQIRWAVYVDGPVKTWRRTIVAAKDDVRGRERYSLHEAFRPGDVVAATAVLPTGLSLDAFIDLLTVAGTYAGISPFKDANFTYGLFEVVSVLPTATHRIAIGDAHAPGDSPLRQSD